MRSADAEHWRKAMDEEMAALAQHQTWELRKPPPGIHLIGCKWVYRLKRDADGKPARYKARLVVKGFSQIPGRDYGELFASVSSHATIRAFF